MTARLFASLRVFTLEDVQNALNQEFDCDVLPRGKTRKVLLVRTQGVLVMEANVFDDIANRDTMGDMSRRKETFPDDFGSALREGSVKFMLCTVNKANTAAADSVIQLLVASRIVNFETTTTVQPLSI